MIFTGVQIAREVRMFMHEQTYILKGSIHRFALSLPPDPLTLAETYHLLQKEHTTDSLQSSHSVLHTNT